jgi:hypothetical protein
MASTDFWLIFENFAANNDFAEVFAAKRLGYLAESYSIVYPPTLTDTGVLYSALRYQHLSANCNTARGVSYLCIVPHGQDLSLLRGGASSQVSVKRVSLVPEGLRSACWYPALSSVFQIWAHLSKPSFGPIPFKMITGFFAKAAIRTFAKTSSIIFSDCLSKTLQLPN